MRTSFKIFILFIFLAIGIFLIQSLVTLPKIAPPPVKIEEGQEIQKEMIVNLKFDFGEGNIKKFENIKLGEEKTVFDLLKKVTQENNLEFSFKEYPDLGVFIESIGNIRNDSERNLWWQYWVNGECAQAGASLYKLKNGDVVEWKYIEPQF
jgi:hypothetical protein